MAYEGPIDEHPIFCNGCAVELTPGDGNFYVVKIEAVADPTPPSLDDAGPPGGLRGGIDELLAQMQDMSEQELMDQVYRRVVIHLCTACYVRWIENPTG